MKQEELQRALLADLGKNYDAQAALLFLRTLEAENNGNKACKNLEKLLEEPPQDDTTLHIIYKTPYVLGEIVVAGKKTRKMHPLCSFHPIHFKKTYLKAMSRWETDTKHEATQSHKVWSHFEESSTQTTRAKVPLPLASSPTTFRSQLLTGKSLGALSPVRHTGKTEDTLKQIVDAKKNFGSIKTLWEGLESLNEVVDTLHNGGFLHNDLHKENLLLCEEGGKLHGAIIDFETTEEDPRFNTHQWVNACKEDKKDLIKEACFLYLTGDEKTKATIKSKNTYLIQQVITKLKSDPTMIYLEKFTNERKIKDLEIN
jgi:hypothetical protein